jgi:quercetin dioxygenase-like cupin family protein
MKKTGLFFIAFLFTVVLSAQHTYHIPSVQPTVNNFENAHILPLDSDSLTSSFMIWVKQNVPLHYHRFHTEQVLILEGEGIMQFGNEKRKVVVGDFITIPPNTVHGVQVTGNVMMKVLSIQSPRFEGKDRILINE